VYFSGNAYSVNKNWKGKDRRRVNKTGIIGRKQLSKNFGIISTCNNPKSVPGTNKITVKLNNRQTKRKTTVPFATLDKIIFHLPQTITTKLG